MDPEKHKQSFLKLLKSLDVDAVCCKEYSKTYLQHLLAHKEYYVSIYSLVLTKVLEKIGNTKKQICLVDYGCGNGLLGLYARHCGFSAVIFQDTDPEFLNAAKKLSAHLNFENVHFIPGDIDLLKHQQLSIDVIAGTDVIEHIYDLDKFFGSVKSLNPDMVTVFTTSANPFNFFVVNRLRKMQRRDELEGNDGSWGNLTGQKHLPYVELRRQMIAEKFPKIENLERLAHATRGLAGENIINAARDFALTNRLPVPAHQFNTCHPVTGSWTERILTVKQYRDLYNKYGFEVEIAPGSYNTNKKGLGKISAVLLNMVIRVLGKTFSPFIIMSGRKK